MLVDAFRIFDILFTKGHQYACAILVLVYKLVLLNRGACFLRGGVWLRKLRAGL